MSRKGPGQAVSIGTAGNEANRLLETLSKQQRAVLDVIAAMTPRGASDGDWDRTRAFGLAGQSAGFYRVADVTGRLVPPGDRIASASTARSITRLTARGLLRRLGYESGWSLFYTLTDAGLAVVNELRRRLGLAELPLVDVPPRTPMTSEEFAARLDAIDRESAFLCARGEAMKLDRAGLVRLRQWIDARLAEPEQSSAGG